jgi:hypothetical protein
MKTAIRLITSAPMVGGVIAFAILELLIYPAFLPDLVGRGQTKG